MTVPFLKYSDFIELLKRNGCTIVSDTFWEKHNRIILQKDGHSFPIQILETYFFSIVVKICQDFGIEPPEDHLKVYNQLKDHREETEARKKEKGA